jgi:hypothetical protein
MIMRRHSARQSSLRGAAWGLAGAGAVSFLVIVGAAACALDDAGLDG